MLVERTVAEVVPAVKSNKGQLDAVRVTAALAMGFSTVTMKVVNIMDSVLSMHALMTTCMRSGGGATAEAARTEEEAPVRVPG